ncbi:baculoviral IAP repeat-containing protein 2-like [Ruditapes philippinarum]|uniref:baculoviral IAP repeat-containing protein 2-like n=1 Tax=Ruditapes philippinarum TaxID=129788 RepID=UPI00295A9FF7|nr:baculoviral IAP repeat-containing protein 2-like [Ruditapes philippinarum]
MFHNTESSVYHNKHWWIQFTKEYVPNYVTKNMFDLIPISLPNICSYIELKLNHINCEYISALNRGDFISKKIFDAWLNRLIFRSLDDKHLGMPYKSKMTDKMYVLENVRTNIMSEPWPTVCIHDHENSNHASETEENYNCNHSNFHSVGALPNEIFQAGKRTSVINLNQRYQLSGTTVDLKTQHAGLQQMEENDDSPNKEEKDPIKSIICHENDMFPCSTYIASNPVFTEESNTEQPQETARTVNDNEDLSATDNPISDTPMTRNFAIDNEVISTSIPPGALSSDEHFLNEASRFTNGDIAHDSGESIQHSLKGCDKPTTNPNVEYVQKTDHPEDSSSTLPSQASETSNAVGITVSDLPSPEVDTADLQRFEPLMHIIDKIAGGERVPPQVTMRYELLRFCTLRSFPKHNKPYITRIAQAGFYFANTDDEVVCYCCARRKSNWREDDIPIEIHRELNPNCSFLLSNLEVNVPVRMSELLIQESNRSTSSQILENTNQTSSASTSDTISCNTSGPTNHSSTTANSSTPNVTQAISSPVVSTNSELSQNRVQPRAHGNFVMTSSASSFVQEHQSNSVTASNGIHASPVVSSSSLRPTSELSAQGTNRSTAPKYPKYASKTARVTSFNDCGDIVIPPDSLATSGFFYAGFGDCVRCFQCGVGLRHWSEEDDPWIEHSRWSKDCLFVKQVRGQEFVNIVQMAVQYSQNQNGNGQTPGGSATGSDAEIERKMHTDAAQSVLEMGYNPHVIRSALRAIRDGNDGRTLSAAILMEKIFELEDEASANGENNQSVQGTPPNQSNTIAQVPVTVNNNTQSQRVSLNTSLASSNSARTQSVPVGNTSSQASLTTNASSEANRTQNKKAQLLEQKKLKQENEQLKQQSMCTKCKQNDVCIVFLPCGHLVTCETCAPTIRYCSVEGCGKYIKGTVRTYLA